MSSEAGPFWNPSKSARSAQQGRLDLPDPDLCSLRPKVVPPSGLSLSPSCTAMNRPRTYMYDGNQSVSHVRETRIWIHGRVNTVCGGAARLPQWSTLDGNI